MTFRPFADDTSVHTIGDLTIENGTDRIVVPSFEVTRDRDGLDRLERVMSALGGMADVLKAIPSLPRTVGPAKADAPVEVANPFARK